MRNVVFGFEHLEHRYRVLTGKEPPHTSVEVRINLNDILKERYGSRFAPDPRIFNLMLQTALEIQDFWRVKKSLKHLKAKTSSKCTVPLSQRRNFFGIIVLAQKGKLKTAGRGLLVRADRTLESR